MIHCPMTGLYTECGPYSEPPENSPWGFFQASVWYRSCSLQASQQHIKLFLLKKQISKSSLAIYKNNNMPRLCEVYILGGNAKLIQ